MLEEGPPLALARIKMSMIGHMWTNVSREEREFFEEAARQSNELADAMTLEAAEQQLVGINETESAGESDDKGEGHILADNARSGGAGKASKAALLSGGAGTSNAVNARSSSGNKSKKKAKGGDAAVERESQAMEEEVDDEAQDKGPSKRPQGKQSARKSSGGNLMVPPARAQTEPVGGKAESKTRTSRSKANVPDAPKTTTKLRASASKTTAPSVVTPTAEVRMTQDPSRGEEAKPADVMDDGIADKVSGGTGAALSAKKGKARDKETTDKGDGLPKDVERAESVKSKEDGGKGNGTTKGGGKSKHKDKSKHSTKGKGEEVQESTNGELVEKRRRAGEEKAERGGKAKAKRKGTGKGEHAKAKADGDENRLVAEPSDPSSAKAPQNKRGKGGDCGARAEKHKGAGKEEGASKSSCVDKRGDKHKSSRKDAGKGAGREEATVENRLEEKNDGVNDTDGGSTGQSAAEEKGDPSETSGVGGINRGKAKGKGKERRSTGVEVASSDNNKDTAATHNTKEKRKDAEKAKVSEKKSKLTLERSGSTTKEATAKERMSSKKSKTVDTNSKGKGKRDKEMEKKSVGKQATSAAPSTAAGAVESEGDDECVDDASLFGLEIGEKCWIEVEWEVEVQKSGRQTQQGVEWFVASVDLTKEVDKGKAGHRRWRINYSRRGSLPASKSKVMFTSASELIDDYQPDEPLRWRKKQSAIEAAAEKAALKRPSSAAGSVSSSGDQEAEWRDDFGLKPRRR